MTMVLKLLLCASIFFSVLNNNVWQRLEISVNAGCSDSELTEKLTVTHHTIHWADVHRWFWSPIVNLIAVDDFCKQASKLILAVAWDLLGSKSAAAVCASSRFNSFIVAFSSKSNLNWSVSARAWAEWRCGLQTLCHWQRRVRACWANQLIPTSPVAKKHSVD